MTVEMPEQTKAGAERVRVPWVFPTVCAALSTVLLLIIYYRTFLSLYANWDMPESYYSHGFLVPFVSAFFVWRSRRALRETPVAPSAAGIPVLLGAVVMFLLGDLFGFLVFPQLSLLPMLAGLILVFLGKRHLKILWFPLVFLIFMIPIPDSLTQSVVLRIKLVATEGAVGLARLCFLPMVQDGSFIHWTTPSGGDDKLLVGMVCGGLRSLISLLALGTLVSYSSRTRLWGRLLILVAAAPIAIVSNLTRIFILCVVGYYWGSRTAVGPIHGTTGILIFVVAFVLLFALEGLLRKIAPAKPSKKAAS